MAYLVIRDGENWSTIFQLVPDKLTSIGRAPTNQIVVTDDRCSRTHAEIFYNRGDWFVRDLGSRNGTYLNLDRIVSEHRLDPGNILRIGKTLLYFVENLQQAYAKSSTNLPAVDPQLTMGSGGLEANLVIPPHESEMITHRRDKTLLLETPSSSGDSSKIKSSLTTDLCKLALDLSRLDDFKQAADKALDALMDQISVDIGAVMLLPPEITPEHFNSSSQLNLLTFQSRRGAKYRGVSDFLAVTVVREGQGIMAQDIGEDSSLAQKDSRGELDAKSMICAPLRFEHTILGLIHLFSTNTDQKPTPADLDYALAVADTLAVVFDNLAHRNQLARNLKKVESENIQLRRQLGVQSELVGNSQMMMEITEQIALAAGSKATVLIRGESGTGKELVARAVHFSSVRANNPFICLNCAALSEDLLASELFGHEKGAFTGATERKIGKFEAADGGTLMLDEIGEMSQNIQAKFLRVLEGHPFERVGGNKPINVDVRVIAATNRDLEKEVTEKHFRRDLFFRLRVLEIVVPALRKRPEDIITLSEYFLKRYKEETGRKIEGFTPSAMRCLQEYRWPGNVRELKNVIERAVVLCRTPRIGESDLLLSNLATAGDTFVPGKQADGGVFAPCSLLDMESKHIESMMNYCEWNKSRAAALLGIERSTLDRKLIRYKIRKPAGKWNEE